MAAPQAADAAPEIDWRSIDYAAVIEQRGRRLETLRKDPELLLAAKVYYRDNPADFIDDWLWTYDPRRQDGLTHLPLLLWPKQRELVEWFRSHLRDRKPGLVEKSRDMGVTNVALGFAIHQWLFFPGSKVSFGSRKESLVDKIGDPDSIFEKARMMLRMLPVELLPKGYNEETDATFMKVVNRANGASITGEAGDNIGRGGRSTLYVVDEAQPLWARILTPSGWRTMGEMRVGSGVIGPDGRQRMVVGVKDAGVHPVYRLTFSDGTSATCSPNHLWTVDKVLGGRWRVTLRTSEIAESYVYRSPGGQTQYRYRLPRCAPVEFEAPREALPLDPYLVGALIGDGSLARSQTSVTFTSADEEVVERLRAAVPCGYAVKRTSRINYRISHGRGRGARRGQAGRALFDALEAVDLRGPRAYEKRIPRRYLLATVAERLDLLRGLMDTDGCSSGGRSTFHTCSSGLAEDVLFLVRSLGGMATHAVKRDWRGHRDMHCVYVAMPDGVSPFHLSRKAQAMNRPRKAAFEKAIVSVEILPAEPVRCITVDAEDGLYVTDGFALTHNSAFLERPMKIDAALSQNTDVRIDISSANGNSNPFFKKRSSGLIDVFTFSWRDDPRKDDAWYEKMKRELDPVIVASEIDIDYNASVEGVCIPAKFVQAAVGLLSNEALPAEVREAMRHGSKRACLDVADEGPDANALIGLEGRAVFHIEQWREGTTTQTTRKAFERCRELGIDTLRYDKIGVGAGVKGESRELEANSGVKAVGINSGGTGPKNLPGKFEDTGRLAVDYVLNVRAFMWIAMRNAFVRTYEMVNGIKEHTPEKLIALPTPAECPLVTELVAELSRPKAWLGSAGKWQIEPKDEMEGASPNLADGLAMDFAPRISTNPLDHIR